MEQATLKILFALLRSAVCGDRLSEQEYSSYSSDMTSDLILISRKHDVAHLLALGLKKNSLLSDDNKQIFNEVINAVCRYEQLNYDYIELCGALEAAKIPFVPLKGSILRAYYPEPWMRTSCDVDVLVKRDDLETAIKYLEKNYKYVESERATHDVALFTPQGKHIELHFDLVEEGRANDANDILKNVWDNVTKVDGREYRYEMSDEFFYYYHIAHMAKHFENGGCGIRPFIDLWILDNIDGADKAKRDELLDRGGLLKFADSCRRLSKCWFGGEELDEVMQKLQGFTLSGGVYGNSENRVAIQQKKRGGKVGYLFSRIFIPYEKLKRYYPILEKHRWLTPFMQVRRWFMLFNPTVAKMAKSELKANKNIQKSTAEDMKVFLDEIGLK